MTCPQGKKYSRGIGDDWYPSKRKGVQLLQSPTNGEIYTNGQNQRKLNMLIFHSFSPGPSNVFGVTTKGVLGNCRNRREVRKARKMLRTVLEAISSRDFPRGIGER